MKNSFQVNLARHEFLAWYGLWEKEDCLNFVRYVAGGENVNSLVVLEVCNGFYKKAKEIWGQRGREA